ncbi:DUF533 domain-containing protein [Rhodobacterales bacterium HKCCE2091]|nr:DUF533 domain-containing protein [Rhodobacterales bacterium HKCCE2091]
MSLLRTLAGVAAGVALAKGASALANRNTGTSTGASAGGSLLDALQGARRTGGTGGRGLPDLGAILGGGRGGVQGGLGGLLDSLGGGGGTGSGSSGGLGNLAGMLGGAGAGGGLGTLLNGLAGRSGTGSTPDFGNRLNEALTTGKEPSTPPTAEEEMLAGLMIRTMIMAAKADGRIDADERQKILGNLKDPDPDERAFIEGELNAPVDPMALAGEVPDHPGLKRQIYATALTAIDLDSQAEAQFLAQLARGLGLSQGDVDAIHRKLGGVAA